MTAESAVIVHRVNASEAQAHVAALTELLADAVNDGASVGFLRPMQWQLGEQYWRETIAALSGVARRLLLAKLDGAIVGAVQLELCTKQNGVHRAEVMKLLVRSSMRRRGIAAKLMQAVEREAAQANRSLLFLDTEAGSGAEKFYVAMNWVCCGSVPGYALSVDGVPTPNRIYYKTL